MIIAVCHFYSLISYTILSAAHKFFSYSTIGAGDAANGDAANGSLATNIKSFTEDAVTEVVICNQIIAQLYICILFYIHVCVIGPQCGSSR